MNNVFQRNFQTNLYNKFIEDLGQICKQKYVYVTQEVDESGNTIAREKHLSFSLENLESLKSKIKVANILTGDREVGLDINVFIYDTLTSKTEATLLKNLITIPILTQDGMFIGGQRKTFTNILEPAKGWQLERKRLKKQVNERYATEETETDTLNMMFRPERGSSLIITTDNTGGFKRYVLKNRKNSSKVILGTALRALIECDWETARAIVGRDSQGLEMLIPSQQQLMSRGNSVFDKSIQECKRELLKVILPYEIQPNADIDYEFEKSVKNNSFYSLSDSNLARVERMFSFYNRCRNTILAKDILVGGKIIKQGTLLTPELLVEIDESNIDELSVLYNSKSYNIIKKKVTNQLDVNHFINATNILLCELDGLNIVKDIDDIENKMCTNAYTFFKDYIERQLNVAFEKISKSNSLLFKTNKSNSDKRYVELKFNFTEYVKSQQNVPSIIPITFRNSVSATEAHYKITSSVKEPTLSQREVRNTNIGFICSQGSPESEKTGITQNMAAGSFSNENGELCNAYVKLHEGNLTDELVFLTSFEAQRYAVLTELDKSSNNLVYAWKYGDLVRTDIKHVDYIMLSPENVSSRWAMIGPFFNSNKSRRTQMSGNHANQYLPVLGASRHIVTSGISSTFDEYCTRANDIVDILCFYQGVTPKLEYYEAGIELIRTTTSHEKMTLEFKSNHKDISQTFVKCVDYLTTVNQLVWSYEVNTDLRTEPKWFNNEIVIKPMDVITSPAEISEESSLDFGLINKEQMRTLIEEKDIGMGSPLLTGVISHKGHAYEDGVGIRESLVKSNLMSNVFTHKEDLELTSNKTIKIIPFKHTTNPKIQSSGLPMLNKYYNEGETIIEYKRTEKITGGDGQTDQKITYGEIKVKDGYSGYIQSADIIAKGDKSFAVVTLGGVMILEIGDKFTGHHGNKGIICKIIPDEEMPCLADGTPLDIFINPLGIPSRMNLGQLKEMQSSILVQSNGKVLVVPPYAREDHKKILEKVESKQDNKLGAVDLYNPKYLRKYENKVNVGYMYFLKLDHSVAKKINAIADSESISSKTNQPTKGAHSSGPQSISELVFNCLAANGCYKTIDYLFAAGSDDISVAGKIREDLMNTGKTNIFGRNNTYKIQHAIIRTLGFNPYGSNSSGIGFNLLTNEDIKNISTTVSLDINDKSILYDLDCYIQENGSKQYKNPDAYVSVDCGNIAWINPALLNSHICNLIPVLDHRGEFKMLSGDNIKDIINGELYLEVVEGMTGYYIRLYKAADVKGLLKINSNPTIMTGGLALLRVFSIITKEDCISHMESVLDKLYDKSSQSKKDYELMESLPQKISMYRNLPEFKDLIINNLLIIPLAFRPKNETLNTTDSLNIIYKELLRLLKRIKSVVDMHNDGEHVNECTAVTQSAFNKFYSFYYQVCTKDVIDKYSKTPNIKSPLHLLKDKDTGITRGSMMKKTVKHSMRSVITGIPDIPLNHALIPKKMIYTTFKYHMVYWLKNQPETAPTFKHLNNSEILNIIEDLKYNRLGEICKGLQVTWEEAKIIYNTVYEVTNRMLLDEFVFLVREPALQRQNAEAFVPRLTEAKAIGINFLICTAYNADFDGDQMAGVEVPNEECKEELRQNMTPDKLLEDDQSGECSYPLKQDVVLGFYNATSKEPSNEPKKVYSSLGELNSDLMFGLISLKDTVKFDGSIVYTDDKVGSQPAVINLDMTNTAGRLFINLSLPYTQGLVFKYNSIEQFKDDYENSRLLEQSNVVLNYDTYKYDGRALDIYNQIANLDIAEDISQISDREIELWGNKKWNKDTPNDAFKLYSYLSNQKQIEVLNSIKNLGLELSELDNTTVSLDDFTEIAKNEEFIKAINNKPSTDLFTFMNSIDALDDPISSSKILRDEHTKKCLKAIKSCISEDNNLYKIFDSGARGSFNNFINSMIEGGYVKTLEEKYVASPINSNLYDGLSAWETFLTGYEVRNTQLSTTGKTREGGELNRLYSFCMTSLVVTEDDCGCTPQPNKIYYQLSKGQVSDLTHIGLGKHLSKKSDGYNLVGDTTITPTILEYLAYNMVEHVILSDGQQRHLTYEVDPLTYKQYVGRYGYAILPDGSIDYSKEVKFTEARIDEYIRQGKKQIYVRLLWDCKCEHGVCKHCLGDDNVEIGTNIGIRSAQSIAKTLTQLALDKKNAVVESGNTSNITARIKGILMLSKTFKILENSLYANYDQMVRVQDIGDNKVILYANNSKDGFIVSKDRVLVSNGLYVLKGQKLIEGTNSYGYLNDILDIYDFRLLMFLDYWDIYQSNGIDLKPIHFESLTKCQTDSVVVTSSSTPEITVGKYYNKNVLDNLISNLNCSVEYKKTAASFENICLQNGVLKAVCSRDPLSMLSSGAILGYTDSCKELYSKIAVGDSLHETIERNVEVVVKSRKAFKPTKRVDRDLAKSILTKQTVPTESKFKNLKRTDNNLASVLAYTEGEGKTNLFTPK